MKLYDKIIALSVPSMDELKEFSTQPLNPLDHDSAQRKMYAEERLRLSLAVTEKDSAYPIRYILHPPYTVFETCYITPIADLTLDLSRMKGTHVTIDWKDRDENGRSTKALERIIEILKEFSPKQAYSLLVEMENHVTHLTVERNQSQ